MTIYLLLATGLGQGGTRDIQHHHTHTGVIPRIGGLGLVFGFSLTYVLCFLFFDPTDNQSLIHFSIFAGAGAAFLLGFIDDFYPLDAKLKLVAQILIAVAAHECGLSIDHVGFPFTDSSIELGAFGRVLTVIWFISIMNLINLIDGLDGLAGGIGLMLLLLLTYLAYESNIAISLILALGMTGAIIGFLFHNFPPAKVYMGDSGAYMIGFVIAALSLLNSEKGTVLAALIAPVLALALPIADVTFAIIRRALKGLPLFRPDREHIHHRLIRSGFSRQRTVLLLYAVSLVALIGGLLAFAYEGRYLPIFFGFAFVVILFTLRGQRITPGLVKNRMVESLQMRQDARNALYLRDWLIVEVERMSSGKNLWADYRFVLKKMGFCRAELSIEGDQRSFFVTDTPHAKVDLLWQETHEIGEHTKLTLYADKDNFTEKQFDLISDVAAEAWTKAVQRWKEVNGAELNFEAKARPPNTYRQEKARNLYRPTY
ncbi:MAG: hypothetical protein GVY36_00310 [Verrucomicrobia bacterium]|nr:hypothetical protein [Verrucomicrobiota bacterium]